MGVEERYSYLRRMRQRYQQSHRKQRGYLLDEIVKHTGLNRKYACHLMNKSVGPARKKRHRQRGRHYNHRVDDAIRIIGETLDWVCAERMTPVLADTAELLAAHGELELDHELGQALARISISTVGRIVARLRQDEYRLPQRRGRRRATSSLLAAIPAGRIAWEEPDPGHFETDTVMHCGPDGSGDVVCSVQMIDVKTGWSERRAILGRGQQRTREAFAYMLERCPIPIREIHPDNGPEFMNHHLLQFFRHKAKGIKISRSRPYQKNDNRFVEQKNYTLIRAYLGHMRLDTQPQCDLLNELYDAMWVYYNFYQPVLRQVHKTVTYDQYHVPHIHRRHDLARTPLQRLLECDVLEEAERRELLELRQMINPRTLRRDIQGMLDRLWAMAS